MKIEYNPILSWEPSVITFVTNTPQSNKDIEDFRQYAEGWLDSKREKCKCFSAYFDVEQIEDFKMRVVCEWLCKSCLPDFIEVIGRQFPQIILAEIGLRENLNEGRLSFVEIGQKQVIFESGKQMAVPQFTISYSAVTVGEFSAFVAATGYRSVAERNHDPSTYANNSSLFEFSAQARQHRPATCLSFRDARAYCVWSKWRLPSEPEVFSAFLADTHIHDAYDGSLQTIVRSLLDKRHLPILAGATLTDTTEDGLVVLRSGPRYILLKGWEKELLFHRFLRSDTFYDVTTNFHVCGKI